MLVNKNWRRRIWNVVMGMLLMLVLIPQPAFAIDPLEVGADVTLQVNYLGNDDEPVSNAEFCLYKVGEINRFGRVEPSDIFAEYPVAYEQTDAAGWKRLAEILAVYVEKDCITPTDKAVTDYTGTISFPNDAAKMTTGLYLVVGKEYIQQHRVYIPEPTLVCLPNRDGNDDWVYDVIINPKYEDGLERTEIQVIKCWNDNDNKAGNRPNQVEIQLLKNGRVVDTVTLNKTNHWRYTWTGLEASFKWAVLEKNVSAGYTVDMEKDHQTFLLTNTFETTDNTPDEETGPEPEPLLPNTGMLWWPVPILAGGGMIFFTIGWIKRRKSEN